MTKFKFLLLLISFISCRNKELPTEDYSPVLQEIMQSKVIEKYQGFSATKSFRGKPSIIVSLPDGKIFCVVDFRIDNPSGLKFHNEPIFTNIKLDSINKDSILLISHEFISTLNKLGIVFFSSTRQGTVRIGTSIKSKSYNELKTKNSDYFDTFLEREALVSPEILDMSTNVVLLYLPDGKPDDYFTKQMKQVSLQKVDQKWFFYRIVQGTFHEKLR